MLLIVLAVIYTIVLSLNYIIGVIQTPSWLVFLGSVHYPIDYFYYLSLFAQGQTRWFTSIDLYTHDFRSVMLLGFTNVLSGRILYLFGFEPIAAYQVALAIHTLVFFLLVARFLETLYPHHKPARLIAFLLFFFANTVAWSSSFYANAAEPLIRFARVPHKMLGLIGVLLPMIIIPLIQNKQLVLNKKVILYVLIAICGIIVGNINPVQWLLVSLVLLGGTLWQEIKSTSFSSLLADYRSRITHFFPALIFALSGLPMVIYLKYLFTIPPFSQSTVWENMQQVSLNPMAFMESFGPVVLLGIIGIPLYWKRITLPRFYVLAYFLLSIALFISPISKIVHFTNTRFLSAITFFAASVIATEFLIHIPIASAKKRLVVIGILVLGLCMYFTPTFIAQYKKNANLATNNAFIYIDASVYQTFMETKKRTNESDTILVTWPYDGSFPAVTGRRGFMGNPDQTIRPDEKIQQAYFFFDAQISDEAMHQFLIDNGITYVLGFTSTEKIKKPFMKPVYQNDTLTLYKTLP
jgi:hypothetical protein